MTLSRTQRLGLALYSAAGDPWPGRTGWNELMGLLEGQATEWSQGEYSARPAAGTIGRVFWATDAKRLYWDDGAAWTELSPIGGGGTPNALKVGDAGAEGSSRIGARADHTHPVPAPGTPSALAFGGVAAKGTSDAPARSDHVHAVPELPIRTMPLDNYAGGASDTRICVIQPGFNYGEAYKLDFTIPQAGVIAWNVALPIDTEANAAVWIQTRISGVIHRRQRYHNRNRAGLIYFPVSCMFSYPGNVACAVRVEVFADSANTGNVTIWDSSGYYAVIT